MLYHEKNSTILCFSWGQFEMSRNKHSFPLRIEKLLIPKIIVEKKLFPFLYYFKIYFVIYGSSENHYSTSKTSAFIFFFFYH